ncbi:hypothetical protein QC761_605860 [Podospora bellae-mahoneyi]|uniref:Uncharacterized protein n=1 Tax=Podospora bellae-mahoneyi TaxID=2093777 RepID=A0ABR0F8J7_9PEZI|nr:hypothetical protein QC761_605860 [Podospora bellae-mahoneyi]
MSDAAVNQPEVAAAATETPAVEQTTAAPVAEVEMADAAPTEAAAEKSEEKAEEKTEEQTGATKPLPMLKTTAKIDTNYKNNRKYDPSTQEVTDDPVQIRAQVEFWFNDSNLPGDKHMWEQTGGPENKPVSLKHICNFKRMQRFQPYSAVVAALRDSTLLEVSGEEGEEVIKRKVPYVLSTLSPQERQARSVYVKGFGDEHGSSQFEIEQFFSQFGKVQHLKLRRTNENLFKGSVFVEFDSEETADAFVNKEPAATWNGHELLIMKKGEYCEMKAKEIKEGKIQASNSRKSTFWEGKEKTSTRGGRGGARGGRGGRDNRNGDNNEDKKNGFKGGRGGRGGRGRGGRGGRGGNRDNNKGRDGKREEKKPAVNDGEMPTIQATNEKGEVVAKPAEANGKRARENDEAAAPPAKKVDTKTETAAAQ